jgi:hypothetical protein
MNKKAIERDSLYLVGAYVILFAWVVARTIYQDHSALVDRSRTLDRAIFAQKESGAILLQATKDSLNASLNDLKVQCGIKEGMNRTLEQQNRDQQNSINHCQQDAISILAPVAQKTTVVFFDKDESKSPAQARFLLLTNVNMTPVRMNVQCNYSMESVNVSPVGPAVTMGGADRLNSTLWETNITSPAWTPTLPLIATISYSRLGGGLACSFMPK